MLRQVVIVDTETRKARLQDSVKQQEGDLQSRMETIAKAEAAIKRTNGEIERRTKEIVMLNRKYEKLVANMEPGEHVGELLLPSQVVLDLLRHREASLQVLNQISGAHRQSASKPQW